jgi:fumarate hydratase subunit alpha
MKIDFKRIAKELYLKASFDLRSDIKRALEEAYNKERKKLAKEALYAILKNAKIAAKKRLAICQDTGYPLFFLRLGNSGIKDLSAITKGLTEGIREATVEGGLRRSLVSDPLKREGLSLNTPPIFHIEFNNSKKIEIELLVKGFGSENQTKLFMLNPTISSLDIVGIVADHLKSVGSKACPPYIIGIGIGGTADKAVMLSKEATLKNLDRESKNETLRALEKKIKLKVNNLKIGPLGLGGNTTCLGVKILTYPTHIAGLPCAVTVSCHATRSAKKIIRLN